MQHGIVDIFAFQEALLIEAVFGIVLLTMLWVGFRRWLQHKERMGQQIALEAAEQRALMERVEARLIEIEKIVSAGGQEAARLENPATNQLSNRP